MTSARQSSARRVLRGPHHRYVVWRKRRVTCDNGEVVSHRLGYQHPIEYITVKRGKELKTKDVVLLHRQDTTISCGKATGKEGRGWLRESQATETELDDDLPLACDREPQLIATIRQRVPRRFGQPVWRQQNQSQACVSTSNLTRRCPQTDVVALVEEGR